MKSQRAIVRKLDILWTKSLENCSISILKDVKFKMSDRSFRDRLARIADNIDLEQLDGLVNRVGPDVPEEEQPNLHRLIMNLEQNEPVNVVDVQDIGGNDEARQDDMEGVFDYIPNFWGLVGKSL